MGINDMVAMANARKIEMLPYETLKAMFPSVRYMVQGEKWRRKFIGHRTDEITGKEETYAAGEWLSDLNGRTFPNPTVAHQWGELNYSKGHFRVYAYVPELHRVANRIVNE